MSPTGEPLFDVIVYAIAILTAAGLVVKLFGKKEPDQEPCTECLRSDDWKAAKQQVNELDSDMNDFSREIMDQKTRIMLAEKEQEFTKERHEELRADVRQNRKEQRDTAETLFKKFDTLTDALRSNGNTGGG